MLSGTFCIAITLLGTIFVSGPIPVRASDFTNAQQVPTSNTSLPIWPSAAVDPLGRVWLAYANKTEGSLYSPDIFFKIWNGLSWTSPQRVMYDPVDDDVTPFVASLSNGSMMMVWSSNRTGNNIYQLFYRLYNGNITRPLATTAVIRLTHGALNDSQPAAVQDRNGRIWVAWSRSNQTSTSSGVAVYYSDIYYKYFNGTSWSADFPVPGASNIIVARHHQIETTPSITQTKDGRIWIAWASNQTSDGSFDLFYETTSGTIFSLPSTGIAPGSWSSSLNLCCSDTNADEDRPSIVQARNGTIFVFWEWCMGSNCLDNVYFRTSSTNGSTWSSPTLLSAAPTTSQERFPTAVQGADKRVYVFWQKSALTTSQLWYTTSDPIMGVHDIGITGLTESRSLVRSGLQWDNSGATNISATVRNYGDYAENSTLTVAMNSTVIYVVPVMNLAVNQTRVIKFSWQTTLGFWGRYTIMASLQPPPGESTLLLGDNSWTGGLVRVAPPGDVDYDGCVTIIDAALLAYSYGTTPGAPLWNPSADIDHNGDIVINDAAWLAQYYSDCV